MDRVEYNALKKLASTRLGANDRDSLCYWGKKMSRIYLILLSVLTPLLAFSLAIMWLIAGNGVVFTALIFGAIMYFTVYKPMKKFKAFTALAAQDPDLSDA